MTDDHDPVDDKRRRLRTAATTGLGLAGAAGMLVPVGGSGVRRAGAEGAGAAGSCATCIPPALRAS